MPAGHQVRESLREVRDLRLQLLDRSGKLSCLRALLLDDRRRRLGDEALVGERALHAGEVLLGLGELLGKARGLGGKVDEVAHVDEDLERAVGNGDAVALGRRADRCAVDGDVRD